MIRVRVTGNLAPILFVIFSYLKPSARFDPVAMPVAASHARTVAVRAHAPSGGSVVATAPVAPPAAYVDMPYPKRKSPLDDRPTLVKAMTAVTEKVLALPPVFSAAAADARSTMFERGAQIGSPWPDAVDEYKRQKDMTQWEAALRDVTKIPSEDLPTYFTLPFHAYEAGNIGWAPAFEADSAAVTVHAPIFDADAKEMKPEGDEQMRMSFLDAAKQLAKAMGSNVHDGSGAVDAVDVGCSTGRSAAMLRASLGSGAFVRGVDLSAHFLAVACSNQESGKGLFQKANVATGSSRIEFVHAAGESMPFDDESQDVVCVSLTFHELPGGVSLQIIEEAYRVLRPGGFIQIMEMDPSSAFFQRIASIPPAWAAFRATEPWLASYACLDVTEAIKVAGFADVRDATCTPRHRAWVGKK